MHDDRELLERRITRELWERILPLVHADRRPLSVRAGPSPDDLAPFEVDSPWGAPWATTWFEFTGAVPDDWIGRHDTHVAAVIDLGFTGAQAGFQAEGLVVERDADGTFRPRQGIHPRRTTLRLEPAAASPTTLLVEAASNPTFDQFVPSHEGLPETAGTAPLHRLRTADLVLVDEPTEALVHDLDVLDGIMRSLSVDDPRRVRLRAAVVAALDAMPDIAGARRAVAPHLDATATGSRSSPAGGAHPPRHRIVATGHAHIDTAWLWPTSETIRKCSRTFASAVALMDDDPSFVFACSQARQYAWIEERHPELFAHIRERVERGQWVPVGGMWVEADMNLPSGESLARQIVVGQRWFEERFGAPCTEVWIPDVFGYPAGLPQLFAAGGMTRFVTQKLSWNKQNRFPHHTFWWEGLDGTRVLTHFPPVDTYNAEITPSEIVRSVERFQDHAWSSVSLMPFGYGDGGGGPTGEMLERAHRLAGIDPSWTLEIGRPSDVFQTIEHEALLGAPVPVWRGELYFETHRGTLTSQLRTKLGNRRCERLLVEAELWAATLGRPADVDQLWRDVLTQQFHDILPGSSIAWVHRDAEEVFARVEAELEHRIATMLADLIRRPDGVPEPDSAGPDGSAGADGPSDDVVAVVDGMSDELAVVAGGDGTADDGVLAVANRADVGFDGLVVVPAEWARTAGAHGQVLADGSVVVRTTAPALGVVPFVPAGSGDSVVVSDTSMTNGHLAVRWSATGELVSVIDLACAREVVPAGAVGAALELARDRPVEYDAWDLESWTRDHAVAVRDGDVVVHDEGPLVGRVRVTRRFGPSAATITYELRAGARQLLVHVDLDWRHEEHLVSLAFPLDVRADTAACDVQFGVTHRPTHPSSPWDAAKFEVCAHRYVSVAEPSFGVAVLNDGRYGHAVFDDAIRVSLARAARYPDPDADRGRHRVTLALLTHDGDLGDVRAAASLLNQPPRVVSSRSAPPSPLSAPSPSSSGSVRAAEARPVVSIVVDRPGTSNVEVDAVKLADDGSGHLVVRLHEAVGDRTRVAVRARTRIAEAWQCDLLERRQRAEEVGDGIVSLVLRPFELVTLRLRVAPDDFDGR